MHAVVIFMNGIRWHPPHISTELRIRLPEPWENWPKSRYRTFKWYLVKSLVYFQSPKCQVCHRRVKENILGPSEHLAWCNAVCQISKHRKLDMSRRKKSRRANFTPSEHFLLATEVAKVDWVQIHCGPNCFTGTAQQSSVSYNDLHPGEATKTQRMSDVCVWATSACAHQWASRSDRPGFTLVAANCFWGCRETFLSHLGAPAHEQFEDTQDNTFLPVELLSWQASQESNWQPACNCDWRGSEWKKAARAILGDFLCVRANKHTIVTKIASGDLEHNGIQLIRLSVGVATDNNNKNTIEQWQFRKLQYFLKSFLLMEKQFMSVVKRTRYRKWPF